MLRLETNGAKHHSTLLPTTTSTKAYSHVWTRGQEDSTKALSFIDPRQIPDYLLSGGSNVMSNPGNLNSVGGSLQGSSSNLALGNGNAVAGSINIGGANGVTSTSGSHFIEMELSVEDQAFTTLKLDLRHRWRFGRSNLTGYSHFITLDSQVVSKQHAEIWEENGKVIFSFFCFTD